MFAKRAQARVFLVCLAHAAQTKVSLGPTQILSPSILAAFKTCRCHFKRAPVMYRKRMTARWHTAKMCIGLTLMTRLIMANMMDDLLNSIACIQQGAIRMSATATNTHAHTHTHTPRDTHTERDHSVTCTPFAYKLRVPATFNL